LFKNISIACPIKREIIFFVRIMEFAFTVNYSAIYHFKVSAIACLGNDCKTESGGIKIKKKNSNIHSNEDFNYSLRHSFQCHRNSELLLIVEFAC